MSPRWQKVIRDLLANPSRTLLVVSAIAVGVFAFGSVFITQEVLLKNIDLQYRQSHASNITLYLSEFDSTLVNWVKTQPGIAGAQGSSFHSAKLISADGRKTPITLTSVPDFSQNSLNLLKPVSGVWPPRKGEIVIERSSLTSGKTKLSGTAAVEIADDKIKNLQTVGYVYDNSGFPYIFTQQLNGFISWDSLGFLGYPKQFNKLDVVTSADITTLPAAEKVAYDLTQTLKSRGVRVNGSLVLKPNQHWATDNSRAFTAILSVVGIFSLILSGFLVINTISALLSQQRKQIGIMKAIGANNPEVISLYLTMVAVFGLLALALALPVGMGLAWLFLKLVANFLNLDIVTFYLPPSIFLMEFLAALIVPLVAAVIPIVGSSRSSIRSALTDFQSPKKTGSLAYFISSIRFSSRLTSLSFRNIFRNLSRLILTLCTLTTAGALYIAVLNTQAGMYREMDRILSMFDFEISLSLPGDYDVNSLSRRILEIPAVTAVEGRAFVGAALIKSDGSKGSSFSITGLPPETPFSHPVILSGRWLLPSDNYQIVLSSPLARDNPDAAVGSTVTLSINGRKYRFEVVGITAMAGDQKIGFANFATVATLKDQPGLASNFLVKTTPSDAATQDKVSLLVEDRLRRSGIIVAGKETKNQIISSAGSQFNFMVFFLLAMAVMVAIVGGLGLAGTMSLNVMERTREIGIMRSLGAHDGIIRRLVLVEGLMVGLISFGLAIPLSLPLTYGFCYAIGTAFFSRTLVFVIVPKGIIFWLLIVIIVSVISCLLPARRASKMRISETLSYE